METRCEHEEGAPSTLQVAKWLCSLSKSSATNVTPDSPSERDAAVRKQSAAVVTSGQTVSSACTEIPPLPKLTEWRPDRGAIHSGRGNGFSSYSSKVIASNAERRWSFSETAGKKSLSSPCQNDKVTSTSSLHSNLSSPNQEDDETERLWRSMPSLCTTQALCKNSVKAFNSSLDNTSFEYSMRMYPTSSSYTILPANANEEPYRQSSLAPGDVPKSAFRRVHRLTQPTVPTAASSSSNNPYQQLSDPGEGHEHNWREHFTNLPHPHAHVHRHKKTLRHSQSQKPYTLNQMERQDGRKAKLQTPEDQLSIARMNQATQMTLSHKQQPLYQLRKSPFVLQHPAINHPTMRRRCGQAAAAHGVVSNGPSSSQPTTLAQTQHGGAHALIHPAAACQTTEHVTRASGSPRLLHPAQAAAVHDVAYRHPLKRDGHTATETEHWPLINTSDHFSHSPVMYTNKPNLPELILVAES